MRKPFLELTTEEFEKGWEGQVKAAFLFSQAVLPLLLKGVEEKSEFPPSLIFTGTYLPPLESWLGTWKGVVLTIAGATASVRGSALFSAFASAKFGLRALSQSLAREFGPKGVHVAHVIVDGVIDIPKTKGYVFEHEDAKLSPDAVSCSLFSGL